MILRAPCMTNYPFYRQVRAEIKRRDWETPGHYLALTARGR
jgi:hypothetical protein